jgi:hypothetical protein
MSRRSFPIEMYFLLIVAPLRIMRGHTGKIASPRHHLEGASVLISAEGQERHADIRNVNAQ